MTPVRWSFVLAALLLAAPSLAGQGEPQGATCANCHRRLSDERLSQPARDYPNDVHAKSGFGCLACHGDPAMAGPGGSFLARPDRREVANVCGHCHSDGAFMRQYNPSLRVDQVAEYRTSVHGRRLAATGDTSVAVCVSCHPAHNIRPPSDPESSVFALNVATTCGHCHADSTRMAHYGIPTDQESEYESSVHAQWMKEKEDLSAPTCNDCHGNHGAAPPGVGSVRAVCGQCHSVMATLYVGSGHDQYFRNDSLPGCVTCHGNHAIQLPTDERLTLVADSVCTRCHTGADTAAQTFLAIRSLIDSLRLSREQAQTTLEEAENAGMEVSDAQFQLEDATNALVQARTAIHSFNVDSVHKKVSAGLAITTAAEQRGQGALGEHLFRRQGLAVSVGIILLLMAGLVLKIREQDRRSAGGAHE